MCSKQYLSDVKKYITMKKIKLIKILSRIAIIVVFPTYASATDWQLIDNLPKFDLYIDASSVVTKGHSDIRKIRILMSYNIEQKDSSGHKFFSESFTDEFSCANRTRTLLEHTQYSGKNGNGKIISSGKIHPVKVIIEPSSVDELILGEANCNLLSGKW
jgi:hypothetical protein